MRGRRPQAHTHPSRKPEDFLQIRWGEDVSGQHRTLEAGGVGLDAVTHWSPGKVWGGRGGGKLMFTENLLDYVSQRFTLSYANHKPVRKKQNGNWSMSK